MKKWSQYQIMKGLEELVPEINYLEKCDDGSVWTSGEDTCIFKGLPPFDYNVEYGEILLSDNGDTDPKHVGMKVKEMYLCGIHREIYSWLEERGWHPEWYDAGTLFFWVNSDDHESDILEDISNNPEGYQDSIATEILQSLKDKFPGGKPKDEN
jgi:hypothetical protein